MASQPTPGGQPRSSKGDLAASVSNQPPPPSEFQANPSLGAKVHNWGKFWLVGGDCFVANLVVQVRFRSGFSVAWVRIIFRKGHHKPDPHSKIKLTLKKNNQNVNPNPHSEPTPRPNPCPFLHGCVYRVLGTLFGLEQRWGKQRRSMKRRKAPPPPNSEGFGWRASWALDQLPQRSWLVIGACATLTQVRWKTGG